MTALSFRFVQIIAALCLMLSAALPLAVADPQVVRVSQFSGKQVPRYESLRYSAVHGRQGPSLDHPILWRYEKLGLPVLIVRETHGWRRIRDHQGDEVWVQARMLSDKPRALVTRDTIVRKAEAPGARPLVTLKEGVVPELVTCSEIACRVKIDKVTGWVARADLWGTEILTAGL